MTRHLLIGGALLVLVGCGGGSEPIASEPEPVAPPETRVIDGSVELEGVKYGSECVLNRGEDDVPGSQVVIYDNDDKVIGTGRIGEPRPTGAEDRVATCIMSFTIRDVPKVDIYKIEIGRRGTLVYTAAELDEGPLELVLN